jgi:hypothetical protein
MVKKYQLKVKKPKPKQLELNLNWETVDSFGGPYYEAKYDKLRLKGQMLRIFMVMADGSWQTVNETQHRILKAFNKLDPQESIGAQRRGLRKEKFGNHTVLTRIRGPREKGLYEYKLIPNPLFTKEIDDDTSNES